MASNYKKLPVFSQDQTWKEGDLKSVKKANYSGQYTKEEVYMYGGKKGLEFLVAKTLQDYLAVATCLAWTWNKTFNQFAHVLKGAPQMAWEEVINTIPNLYHLAEPGFMEATNQLIKKLLNNNTPRDQ